MKLIKPSYEILPQAPGLEGVYKQIELAGRVCYKSEDKITETSAKEFVDMLIKRGHLSVLEHGTVYLKISYKSPETDSDYLSKMDIITFFKRDPYSRVVIGLDVIDTSIGHCYITTNMRVIAENGKFEALQYICEPKEPHAKRTTVKFICSRSTSHQLVRHRVFSFAQESQRYCNYSLNKFNNEITFVYPSWLEEFDEQRALDESPCPDFTYGLLYAEQRYFDLLEQGLKPQQARQILPNACKTEIVVTGYNNDWEELLDLRCSAGADPDIKQLMNPLKEELCFGLE